MKTSSKQLENQLAKNKAGKTGAELRAFAAESNIELSPDLLEAINGGGMSENDSFHVFRCDACGSRNLQRYIADPGTYYAWGVRCKDCGWTITSLD